MWKNKPQSYSVTQDKTQHIKVENLGIKHDTLNLTEKKVEDILKLTGTGEDIQTSDSIGIKTDHW